MKYRTTPLRSRTHQTTRAPLNPTIKSAVIKLPRNTSDPYPTYTIFFPPPDPSLRLLAIQASSATSMRDMHTVSVWTSGEQYGPE